MANQNIEKAKFVARNQGFKKAKLIPINADKNKGVPVIEVMFNPTDISFSRSVNWSSSQGNRGSTLLPKINFSGVEPYKFTLKQLVFDTYESKTSVMEYINKIKRGVETITVKDDKKNNSKDTLLRPPVYIFTWGTEYFHCVMTSLTYTLTMFLYDGTPVRAMVDISLQEVVQKNLPRGKESPKPRIIDAILSI